MTSNISNILLVEDQPTDIIPPYRLMQHLGFDVTLAFDGEQAFKEILTKKFDLIILDWNLPLLSGSQLLSKLEEKGNRRNIPVPIVLYSGENLQLADIPMSPHFEIVAIWLKPLKVHDIAKKIKELSLTQNQRLAG